MTKQISLELTSLSGKKIFIVTSAVHVTTHLDHWTKVLKVVVDDGIHNNGGFQVKESYEEVVKQIKDQLK